MIRKERDPMHRCFSIIYRHGRIIHDRAMSRFGLTGQEMSYLKYIYENPGISQEELAKKQCIDKGAVAKSIKGMIEKEFIRREQNPQDRRAYRLYMTKKAETICEEGKKKSRDVERALFESLTPDEIETFKRLLIKVTDNMLKHQRGGEN